MCPKEWVHSSEYINGKTKIKIRHNKCGNIYEVRPNDFLHGNRCPRCFGKFLKTAEQFKREVYDLVDNEYTILGEYKNTTTKIKMLHNKCGHKYEMTPNHFLQGQRCPKCNQAKGEERIYKFLVQEGLEIKPQFKIKECKNIIPLPFDFAIFKNNALQVLIEYDGILHFQPIDYFGGQESLKDRKKNDEIKNKYCEKNRVPLIRINYINFDSIEKNLEKELKLLALY